MKFVDVKNDIAFRKIFGNDNKKVILISFLNAVMDLHGDACITDVAIMNPYQLPIIQNLKASIVDLRARDAAGNSYIIEMQVSEPEGLDKRLQYYASKEYVQQIQMGEDYPRLKPVIFIGIFEFVFTASEKCVSHHAFCDVNNGDRVLRDIDFFFVELPKFKKALEDIHTIQEKWIFFLKEAENLELVPENLNDAGLVQAYNDAATFNWTQEELREYDYASMREQDMRGVKALAVRRAEEKAKAEGLAKGMEKGLAKGMEKGLAKGLAKGKTEGKDEGQAQIVRFLAAKGHSAQEITNLTGLSLERVEALLPPPHTPPA